MQVLGALTNSVLLSSLSPTATRQPKSRSAVFQFASFQKFSNRLFLFFLSTTSLSSHTNSYWSSIVKPAFAFQLLRPLSSPFYQRQARYKPTPLSFFKPLSPSTFSTMDTCSDLEEQLLFTSAATKRISCLFSRQSSNAGTVDEDKDYSTKNKSRELKRLATMMDVKVPKVKALLQKQSLKLDQNSEKAKYVQWLLSSDNNKGNKSNGDDGGVNSTKAKKPRKNSDAENNKRTPEAKKAKIQDKNSQSNNNNNSSNKNSDPKKNSNLHSSTKFQDIELNSLTKKAISSIMNHEYMTDIQSRTYEHAKSGTDVLGRARTGTGKTLAFLIPALERILNSNDYTRGKNIGVLIISPTRELATQIGDQAEQLLTYHKGLSCQVMFGGTKMNRDINTLNKRLPTILVATPGRLLDHLENTKLSNGKKFGHDIMRDTPLLVLDEADRLLDMGFKREIQKIMSFLPRQERRQTLLFSATVPQDLKMIMAENMREDYVEVDCIGGDGSSEFVNEEHTNTLVEQTHVILPSLDRYVTSVVEIVKHAMKEKDHKLVVFFPTARLVGFFAEFFNLGLGIDVLEIHSRKTQGNRNQASEKFRKAKSAVLFTSDVSARGKIQGYFMIRFFIFCQSPHCTVLFVFSLFVWIGVDYPDVSGVIQFGLPESRDQYIHRLGRTGRAGKDGCGILVLSPFESKFVSEVKDLDIPVNEEISQILQQPVDAQMTEDLDKVFNRIRSGDAKLTLSAQQAYQAFIGYYRGNLKRTGLRNTEQLVDVANECSRLMGLKEVPGLTKKAAGKMGLQKLPNVRIVDELERRNGDGRQGRRNQGGKGRRHNTR